MDTFTLYDYKILTTGVDGGHRYLAAEVEYEGLNRQLVVFFDSKSDERTLTENAIVIVDGSLSNEGLRHSLILNNATLLYQQPRRDKEIIQLLRTRHGIETEIILRNGEKKKTWNITEGYDMGEAYANMTTNISPSIDGATIDLINISDIVEIVDPLTKEILLTPK